MLRIVLLTFLYAFTASCNLFTEQTTKTYMDSSYNAKEWILSTNIYEVNLRQYTQEGTFKAFATEENFNRLRDMGVQTLWFMPITPIAQKNKKGTLGSQYAAADYITINPEFGTMDEFKQMVREAQGHGFKVLIDWVANHTGWDHKWTIAHPDWYLKDSATNDFKKASGMDDIIELDYSNKAMRKAMIDAMKFWVREADIDGFRCDLASWVEVDFWEEAKPEVEKIKPLLWLGELDPIESPDYMRVFDAAYTWTWMHATRKFYHENENVRPLDSLLQQYLQTKGLKAWFTTNHDENSWNGTEYEKYGNAAKALAVFSCTWPGIPLIYNGQEMPNNKRLQFFEKDAIEWNGKYELHNFYKTLLDLHATNPALLADERMAPVLRLNTSENDHILAYVRKNGVKEVVTFLNLSNSDVHFSIQDYVFTGNYKNAFTGVETDLSDQKAFEMKPWQWFVWEK